MACSEGVVEYSDMMRHNPQGMVIKPGKNSRVVWDASTKLDALNIILNDVTSIENKPEIDFGNTKQCTATYIYNSRISYPWIDILLAAPDIKACFRYGRQNPDMTGAFGFRADGLYFLATSMVFGSNTSAPSWEPFRRAIESMTLVYFGQEGLIKKHQYYLDLLV